MNSHSTSPTASPSQANDAVIGFDVNIDVKLTIQCQDGNMGTLTHYIAALLTESMKNTLMTSVYECDLLGIATPTLGVTTASLSCRGRATTWGFTSAGLDNSVVEERVRTLWGTVNDLTAMGLQSVTLVQTLSQAPWSLTQPIMRVRTGMGSGSVAGVVLGCMGFVVLVIAVTVYLRTRNKIKNAVHPGTPNQPPVVSQRCQQRPVSGNVLIPVLPMVALPTQDVLPQHK